MGRKKWSAKVYTNDPQANMVRLVMEADVKVPIYLSNRYVYLYGVEGQAITKEVEVRAELDKPLKLDPIEFNLMEKLSYSLEEIEKGRKFMIRFTTNSGPPETYQGFLKLKTNYPERPEMTIWIRGRVTKKSG